MFTMYNAILDTLSIYYLYILQLEIKIKFKKKLKDEWKMFKKIMNDSSLQTIKCLIFSEVVNAKNKEKKHYIVSLI